MEKILTWKSLTRRWQHLVLRRIDTDNWPITAIQDQILLFTLYGKPDSFASEYLRLPELEIKLEKALALSVLLRTYYAVAKEYPSLPEVIISVASKLEVTKNYVNSTTPDEYEKLVPGAIIGRLIGSYFDVKSKVYLEKNRESLTLSELAEKTGYSESQLGHLLRDSLILGEKVKGEWKSTEGAVEDYLKEETLLGSPRGARRPV